MRDIQDETDPRGITIDGVGIAGYRHYLTFEDGTTHHAGIASTSVLVDLDASQRGTHMSRMVEIIEGSLTTLRPYEFGRVLETVLDRLGSEQARVTIDFDFGTTVTAPVSGLRSTQVHKCSLTGTSTANGPELLTAVTTQVTSLCPCSQAISDYGAHNQRSSVTLAILGANDELYPLGLAGIVDVVRNNCSFPVFPLVKRPDERAMTMGAFDRPMFVEDMARDISLECVAAGLQHRVDVRNHESIHSHDAVAVVDNSKGRISRLVG